MEIDVVKVIEVGVGFGLGCRCKQRSCGVVSIEIETLYGILYGAVGGNEQTYYTDIVIIPIFVQSASKLIVG